MLYFSCQILLLQMKVCQSYWHEHWTIICSTQLGDTVQEDSGHLLVLVLHKAEHFKGKAAHLALPIFKHGCLGIFFTAGSGKGNQKVLLERRVRQISQLNKISLFYKFELPKEKIIAEVIIRVSRGRGVAVVHQNVPPI